MSDEGYEGQHLALATETPQEVKIQSQYQSAHQRIVIFSQKLLNIFRILLTLFLTGAGHYGQGHHKLTATFKALGLESPNFTTLYLLVFAKTQ